MRNSLFGIFFVSTLAFAGQSVPWEKTRSVEVCTIPLPVTKTVIDRTLFETKHIYLKIDGQTFGTPFTTKGTYFGGDAWLETNDPFQFTTKKIKVDGKDKIVTVKRDVSRIEKCYPVQRLPEASDDAFKAKISCIVNRLAIPTNPGRKKTGWVPVFTYHALTNNCGAMARYLVECGGGEFPRRFNFHVGEGVDLERPAKIYSSMKDLRKNKDAVPSTYGEICQKVLQECDVRDLPLPKEGAFESDPTPAPCPDSSGTACSSAGQPSG